MLRVANLHELFIKAEVGTDDFHVTIPFVHIEGDAPQVAIKPLNLNYADTTRIYDHGGHWVDRVNRLRRNRRMPAKMVFTVESPGNVVNSTVSGPRLPERRVLPSVGTALTQSDYGFWDEALSNRPLDTYRMQNLEGPMHLDNESKRAQAAIDIANELAETGAIVLPFRDREGILQIAGSIRTARTLVD
jgi:hypothetical protein